MLFFLSVSQDRLCNLHCCFAVRDSGPTRPESAGQKLQILIQPIETMNWTKFQAYPNLTREQIVFLTTLGRMNTHIRPSSLRKLVRPATSKSSPSL